MSVPVESAVASKPTVVRKRSFGGDTLKLISGTGTSQVIGIVAAPIIARLFSPEAFGMVGMFAALSSIIGVIVCLRYELSIVLPPTDEEAAKPVWLCLALTCAMTVLTLVVVWIGAGDIMRWTHTDVLRRCIWFLPISVFFTGLMAVLNSWNSRKREFGRLTVLQVVARCCITTLQLIAGFAGFATGDFLVASTLIGGLIVPTFILGILTWPEASHIFTGKFRWEDIPYALKRYSRFPRYNTASAVIGTVGGQSPVLLLAVFFSPFIAGQYSMGSRLLRVPMSLIGGSFSRAFFPHAAEANHRGKLQARVESSVGYLMKMALFPCLMLAVVGKDLFLVAFGQRWAEAGVFCQIMGPWLFMWFLVSPLNSVLLVLEEQKIELRYQSLIFGTRVASLLMGGLWLGSARVAVLLLCSSGVVVYCFYSSTILKKVGLSLFGFARMLGWNFLMFLPAGVLLLLLKVAGARPIYVCAASAVLLVLHYLNVVRMDPFARRTVVSLMQRFLPARLTHA